MANKLKIFPILSVMFLDQTCLSVIFPVLTFVFFDKNSRLFGEDTSMAVRSLWYGFCISIPHIVNIFVTPFLSSLSDYIGRKKIIMLATVGALLISLVGALSILLGLMSLFIVGCVFQGIFSRTDPIAIASIGDVAPKDKKIIYMGYLQTAISFGAFLGPILGGFFATKYFFGTLNFSMPFLIGGLFAIAGIVVSGFFFKETLSIPAKTFSLRQFTVGQFKKLFANPILFRITLILLLSQFSWRIYYQYIPPILKVELGLNAHQVGWFVGMIAFWLMLATTIGIRFLEKYFSIEKILQLSLLGVFAGLILTILFCVLHQHYLIWLAVIPIAMGDVIAFSSITTLYSDNVEKEAQGTVMGLCFIVVAMIWSLTGFLGGLLMSIQPLLPLLVAPVGVGIGLFVLANSQFEIMPGHLRESRDPS